MVFTYLIIAMAIILVGNENRVVDAVNVLLNTDASGVAIFWFGLLITFVVQTIIQNWREL